MEASTRPRTLAALATWIWRTAIAPQCSARECICVVRTIDNSLYDIDVDSRECFEKALVAYAVRLTVVWTSSDA